MRKRLIQFHKDGEECVLTVTSKVNGTGKRYAYLSMLHNGREVVVNSTYRMIDDYEYLVLEENFMNGVPVSCLVTPRQYFIIKELFLGR